MGAALGLIAALAPVIQGKVNSVAALSKAAPAHEAEPEKYDFEGLDLLRLDIRPGRVSAPLPGGRMAELTLDPVVQRAALRIMKKYRVPEAGVVALDPKTGQVLAYASHVAEGEKFDVNARAEAPAASVFKVVTGAALVEKGGLTHTTEQCYRGGHSMIMADELRDDPDRDKWCATLGIAMGRSLNVVFARLAQKHLTPEDLTEIGGALGFGTSVPFEIKNEASQIAIPDDPLEFARTSAGFWNTSLSPLAAASMVQTIANRGVTLKPTIVRSVVQGNETIWKAPEKPIVVRHALKPETAEQVAKMMENTVRDGSAYKTFHDRRGTSFLPGINVAGKTGTLTRHKENRHYTWLVAYAPMEDPEIVVAALVVNTPQWHIKGPDLARDVLRAYFANKGRPGVSAP
jgi:cell division protein FtsI/penicillin-binding protein 2